MKVSILGKRKVGYTKKDTGEYKEYAELYYCYNAPSSDAVSLSEGKITDKVYIPVGDYDDIPIDCDAVLDFDNRGRFVGLELV